MNSSTETGDEGRGLVQRLLARLALPPSVRLPVHALGITQIISWGTTFYAPAILAAPLIAETQWSKTEVFGAFSASLIVGALLARPVGRLIDRGGGRMVMSLGSLLATIGLFMLAGTFNFTTYVAAWVVLGIAMRLALYEAAFATLTSVAGRDARRAISVLTLYGGFASSVFWPIGWLLVEAAGWRVAFAVFAALNLLVCLPMHFFLLPRSATHPPSAKQAESQAESVASLSDRERRLALVTLTAAFALFSFMNSALSAHLIDTLVALGLPAAVAVSAASLRGVGQVAGRLWEILFAARLKPLALCLVAFGFSPIAFLILAVDVRAGSAILFTFFQGVSNGLTTIAKGVAPLLLFGPQGYGALIGTMAGPSLVTAALAPAIHAAVVDVGGYRAGLFLDCAAASLAVMLVLLLAWRLRGKRLTL